MKKSSFERMPRRHWLGAGAGALSALAWPQAPAQPAKAPEMHLRLAAAWPDKMPGLSDAVRRWAQRVNTLSGGKLHMDVRFSGESGIPPLQLLEAVQSDALAQEIHRSYTAYLQNQLRWAEVADRAYWQARYA